MKRLSVLTALIGLCLWAAGCSEDKKEPVKAPSPSQMANEAKDKGPKLGADAEDGKAGAGAKEADKDPADDPPADDPPGDDPPGDDPADEEPKE